MSSRNDVLAVPGGDTVQMLETKRALERQGVDVQMHVVGKAPPLAGFDLVHIFNLEQLEPFLLENAEAPQDGPPVVLSPIFWFHTGHWYEEAVLSTRLWSMLHKGVGACRGRRLYEGWQGIKFRRGARGRKLREYLAIPCHLMPNSKMELDYLKSALGVEEDLESHCTIVPNGVARRLYDPLPARNEAFLRRCGLQRFVLQVARIQSAKNQLGVIEALYDTSMPIVFIGQPSPYEPDYVNRCYDLAKQRGNVHFIGPQSPEELAGIYVSAAVHVLPSWRETPGLASLEAAAAGCRVVSTSIGSALEYFGGEAWYCDPGDRTSIREAVLGALSSPPSERLRNRVLERYTWDKAAESTLEVYRSVRRSARTVLAASRGTQAHRTDKSRHDVSRATSSDLCCIDHNFVRLDQDRDPLREGRNAQRMK